MEASLKKSDFRSEFRTIKGMSESNYLLIRFWDNANSNWEYHIYAEVVAKQAARDIGKKFGLDFSDKSSDPNVRTILDKIWKEHLD